MDRRWLSELSRAMDSKGTLVCVGLDPIESRIPLEFSRAGCVERGIFDFLAAVVDITIEHACAYKIQKAFFDRYPGGHAVLADLVSYIKSRELPVLVILDGKIGDIENTMLSYLETFFGSFGVDAVVVNPYMGYDVLLPFSRYPERAAIVLVCTSNPGGGVVQDVILADGRPLWLYILEKVVVDRWKAGENIFPVLSSRSNLFGAVSRSVLPDDMPIFFAGVGAQGGDIAQIRPLLDSRGGGVLVNSARAILYPYQSGDAHWRRAVEGAVVNLKNSLVGV